MGKTLLSDKAIFFSASEKKSSQVLEGTADKYEEEGRKEAGADPGFQVRGAHLKKLRRAEGGAKIFGVFRVKNHDFTPKNRIFSNFRGGARGCAPPPCIRPWEGI